MASVRSTAVPGGGDSEVGSDERSRHPIELTAIIEREGDGYVALCPEVDVASQGDSVQDARMNLQEALELFFETASHNEIARRLRPEVYITRVQVSARTSQPADVGGR